MKQYFERLYKDSAQEFYKVLKLKLINNEKTFIVTANPETFMLGDKDCKFNELLLSESVTIIPDGIGIVKAARMLKYDIKERIPGVEIVEQLFKYGNELEKTVVVLGSKQEVLDELNNQLKHKYPKLNILNMINGYGKDKDKDFKSFIKMNPDIVLVALGIPIQEKLMYQYFDKFKKGIFIGVGGSLDVLSGTKKRAPKLFQKLNIEWLYRLTKEPKRIKRFYDSNVKFILKFVNKKKMINILFFAILLLILIGGFIKPIFKPNDINYYENRKSYTFSEFNFENIRSGKFQNDVELVYSDQIPLSNYMKKGYNYINNILKKYSVNLFDYTNMYVPMENGIALYNKKNLVYYPMSYEDREEDFDKKINNLNEYFAKYSNLDFYVYYIKKDTDINFEYNSKTNTFERIKNQLNIEKDKITNFEINNFEEFKNYFYETDHHWNYKGSYKAYKEVLSMMNRNETPLIPENEICLDLEFVGSKSSGAGLQGLYSENFCAYKFNLPSHITYINNELKEYGLQSEYFDKKISYISYGDFYGWDDKIVKFDYNQKDKPNLLIFGESYDNAINLLLASHFNITFNIDLRRYDELKEKFNFDEFIIKNKIDQVLLIGNYDYFSSDVFMLEG